LSEHCDEKETLAKALRELRERATHLESQLPDLEQANKQLSVQIKNLLTNEELALANKENNSSHFEVEKLRKKIDELTKEIASKDLRIKKLDSVKLTKEQCNALKKMKIEREEFQQEAKDYRSKLRQAEKEIAMLKATSNVATAGGFNGDEVASLTFAKDALETKLRKYAAHCQRLESDKATIVDALKSCDRHTIVDGDLAGAIVTLCDQLSSLEEECDALSSAEGRASSYLMEMEKIRDQVAGLQKELSVAQEKISTLARSEADLVINLKDAKEKLSSLRSERDQFKGIVESEKGFAANKETEKSRQIKFLEQENLQLMLDLKTTKKQLQGSRAELDNMRMRALDDTEDLNDFALHASAKSITLSSGSIGSITSSDPLTPDKENIPNFVRRDGSKRKSIAGSVKKMLGTRSARKKARTNPPGLGEPGRDEDNTENCQQS
jgi:chromosome segregation ATPase